MKICSVCNQEKPLDDFYKDRGVNASKDGRRSSCAVCCREKAKEKRLLRQQSGVTVKQKKCSNCGEVKEAKYFDFNSDKASGLSSMCKLCRSLHYQEIKPLKREYWKEYRENNREQIAQYQEEYRNFNRESIRDNRKIYVQKNKDKVRASQKDWARKYASYDSYSEQIGYAEVIRDVDGFLQAKCAYCGRWMFLTNMMVVARLQSLRSVGKGESRPYCSDGCKQACPIFWKRTRYRGQEIDSSSREVQPELRKMALERDGYTCQRCEVSDECISLHCHHIKAVADDPIESADLDNVIILCSECHKEVHQIDGCKYYQLKKCV